jgi:hypothetical protein
MKTTIVSALAVLGLLATALPAAGGKPEPVGARINVLTGTPLSFPAGAPFHIRHGWILGRGPEGEPTPGTGQAHGAASFGLDVDGVPQDVDFAIHEADPQAPLGFAPSFNWVFNFQDGLPAGAHALTGHWYLACGQARLFTGSSETCELPNETVEVGALTRTVTFTGP